VRQSLDILDLAVQLVVNRVPTEEGEAVLRLLVLLVLVDPAWLRLRELMLEERLQLHQLRHF
jgi:hypothetical protein